MKSKYSKQLIFDYVNGNDIVGYNIEELENDMEFMIEVIDFTNDKNMYSSEKIKKNYELVKFMVQKFKDDKNFIIELSKNFIKNSPYLCYDSVELSILMSDITGEDNTEDLDYFGKVLMPKNIFFEKINYTASLIAQKNRNLDMGFIVFQDALKDRTIILDFVAKEFIKKIFYSSEEYTFEELIHKNIKNFDSVKQRGINNYLINYIGNYDKYLADYIMVHLNVLDDLKKELNRVSKEWNKYLNRLNITRVEIAIEEINEYFLNNSSVSSFSFIQLMEHLIKKYKVEDIFHNNEQYQNLVNLDLSFDDEDSKKQNEKIIIDKNNPSLIDIKYLEFGDKIFKKLFEKDVIDKSFLDDGYIDKKPKKNKAKVIKIDFKNKQNN